ncbi:MAG: tripartite tricarboxylate transporter permease [Desulfovibrionaceae bacterium]|nr:tripartite tricarboxylate transporter permease [Desulfovibrionaceae bacterium]
MDALTSGLYLFLDPALIVYLGFGVVFGLFFGVVPGLTATLGVILLIPATYAMSSSAGLAMLIGIYVGGISGGLVSATLIGMPGTPASVATTFDAFPMARKGQAGKALGLGVTASFLGSIVSGFALIGLSPLLARFALSFGPFEYSALFLFGITIIISMAGKSPVKALMATMIGLCLSTVGMDPVSGFDRNTLGFEFLENGINYFSILMGLFVISEILNEAANLQDAYLIEAPNMKDIFPPVRDLLRSWLNIVRSSIIGIIIGILPGLGPALSNLLAYDQAKRASKAPETFGQGNPDGIIASEAANNATIGGALIPMLTLGIPGDSTTAAIMGGFMVHGIRPGPLLFQDSADLVYCLFISYFAAVFIMYFVMMFGGIRFFAKSLRLPKCFLLPLVSVMSVAGAYNLNGRMTDVWIVLGSGILGFFMSRHAYPRIPIVIALILAPMFEAEFRRAMTLSQGSLTPFITQPISLFFFMMFIFSIVGAIYLTYRQDRKQSGGI